jgi:hypothetical protein
VRGEGNGSALDTAGHDLSGIGPPQRRPVIDCGPAEDDNHASSDELRVHSLTPLPPILVTFTAPLFPFQMIACRLLPGSIPSQHGHRPPYRGSRS